MDKQLTADERIEAVEKRRAERKALLEVQQREQLAVDLEAYDALEVEHGDGKLARINLATYTPGLPTFIVARCATRSEHKRLQDQVARSNKQQHVDKKDAINAVNLVADACIVYPDRETYAKIREVCGAVHTTAGNAAIDLFGGKVEEEGKD